MEIKTLVDRIVADGKLTAREYAAFLAKVEGDGWIDTEENEQISRLLRAIADGTLAIEEEPSADSP